MKYFISTILIFVFFIQINAQVDYSANDIITPYDKGFKSGMNPGYYGSNWNNYTLADIMGQNDAVSTNGLGVQSLRTNLPESFAEIWSYDTWVPIYDYYKGLGLEDNTLVIGISSPDHRLKLDYCPNDPVESEMFENLYEPIWDDGQNGTPVNENNYFAVYVYNLVQKFGPNVKFWEIWNEPGFDISGKSSIPKGQAGNWWDNDPEPCDYILRAPIYYYIRTLRISYEVIKTLSPEDYVVLSGVGNDSFLDALLRNTDNPNQGFVIDKYPLKSGAYFDVMGFHAYPSIDGSVREWNNDIQDFDYTRHSDGAVKGFLDRIDNRANLLSQYGYDGTNFPKKLWSVTEYNVPRVAFGEQFGSDELQKNYLMKMVNTAIEKDIVQTHLYAIGETYYKADAEDGFHVMGIYEKLNDIHPGDEIITEGGIGFKTAIKQLADTRFDQNQTDALNLPSNIEGGAYRQANGDFIYSLWAKTETDNSEIASTTYSFPTNLGITDFFKIEWDYAQTNQFESVSSQNLLLTGTPIYLNPNQAPSTLTVTFPDGNILEGTGTNAEGGAMITWADPVLSTTCSDMVFTIDITNKPVDNFYPFGESTVSYKITDACGNVSNAAILIKVASTGGPGNNCHPHHWDFNFLGSFEDHKYLLSRTKMTNDEAKALAEVHGAQLVSIETKEENDFIKQQLYEVAVIGLSDSQVEGELAWESGNPVTFTQFDDCDWCGTNTENNDYLEYHPWNGSWSFVDNDGEYYHVLELACVEGEEEPVYSLEFDCFDTPSVLYASDENGAVPLIIIPNYHPNIESDCPSGYSITSVHSWGLSDTIPIGENHTTYYAVDTCGNLDTCITEIIVLPRPILEITCPESIIINATSLDGAIVEWQLPEINAECGILQSIQSQGLPSGSIFPIGTSTIEYAVVDQCVDVIEYCSFLITVNPWIATTIVECPSDISIITNDLTGIEVDWEKPVVTTDCPGGYQSVQVLGPNSGSLLPVGITQIGYDINDQGMHCETELNCNFEIEVIYEVIDAVSDISNDGMKITGYAPNPTTDIVMVSILSQRLMELPIIIRNSIGQVLKSYETRIKMGGNEISVSLNDVAGGVYYLEIGGEKVKVIKL